MAVGRLSSTGAGRLPRGMALTKTNSGLPCAPGIIRPRKRRPWRRRSAPPRWSCGRQGEQSQQSWTLDHIFERAGVTASAEFLASYFEAWDPHTLTDPDAPPLLRELRRRGIKIGVLSNTMWPRSAHEQIFIRDEVFELIDGAVYSSEIHWVKPHPEAFRAAMTAIGETDPADCVFVGDRPYDDIYGAKSAGMRAVLIANSDVPGFEAAEPDAVITRLAELLGHVDRWT